MPKRRWAVRSGKGVLKTKAGPVRVKPTKSDIFKADVAETASSKQKTDELMRNLKPLMILRELNKLKKHEKELGKELERQKQLEELERRKKGI